METLVDRISKLIGWRLSRLTLTCHTNSRARKTASTAGAVPNVDRLCFGPLVVPFCRRARSSTCILVLPVC